jgi:tetratricopeptide (TPR) repeat protein
MVDEGIEPFAHRSPNRLFSRPSDHLRLKAATTRASWRGIRNLQENEALEWSLCFRIGAGFQFNTLAKPEEERMAKFPSDIKGPSATQRRHASEAIERAFAAQNPEDIEQAAADLETIIASDAADPQAWVQLGVLRFWQNLYEEAYRHFAVAARLLPAEAAVLANLAATALILGRHEEAISWCDQSLALEPNAAKVWNTRGSALRALGRAEEAAACFERALSLDPNFVEALSNYGATLKDMRRFDLALAAVDKALSLRPDSAPLHCNRGAVLVDLDRPAEALLALDQALALEPRNVVALSNRAGALKLINRTEEALLCCEAALALDSRHAAPWITRADALAELGRTEEALASFDEGLTRDPQNLAGLANKSIVLADMGRFAEAAAMLRRAIALAPQNTSLYYNLTQSEKLASDDPAVAAMIRLADQGEALAAKDRVLLHYALAKFFEDNGEWEAGFPHLTAGAALQRRLLRYDETAELDEMAQTARMFDKKLCSRLRGGGEHSLAPIFIVGMPRSGSTLVEQIISSHEGVRGLGEIGSFRAAMHEAVGRLPGGLEFPGYIDCLSREDIDRIGAAYARRVALLAPPGQRIVDKALDNFRHLGLVALALPQARIIHIRRDPIETCLSCFSKWFSIGYAFSYDLGELGRYYRAYQRLMDHWSAVLPEDSILTVDYEAVVSDLEGQSRRMAAFCGLKWDPRCLEFHKTERQVRTASRMQVRQPLFDGSSRRGAALAGHLHILISALGGDGGMR